MLTFAIGDVHGCLDKLVALWGECHAYSDARSHKFVMLGDYIDRGPQSAAVVDLLIKMQHQDPERYICLKGNHEAMLLSVVEERSDSLLWFSNGGEATLDSYGAETPADLPVAPLEWMRRLPLFYDDGLRFFVHAGVNHNVALDQQSEETMLWARNLSRQTMNPRRFIVHGHFALRSKVPDLERYRLNLDTGAVFDGPLTAAAFDDKHTSPLAFITDSGTITDCRPVVETS